MARAVLSIASILALLAFGDDLWVYAHQKVRKEALMAIRNHMLHQPKLEGFTRRMTGTRLDF